MFEEKRIQNILSQFIWILIKIFEFFHIFVKLSGYGKKFQSIIELN